MALQDLAFLSLKAGWLKRHCAQNGTMRLVKLLSFIFIIFRTCEKVFSIASAEFLGS